jgi:hypothetical protein
MRKNARVSQPGGPEPRSGERPPKMGLGASTLVNVGGDRGSGATRGAGFRLGKECDDRARSAFLLKREQVSRHRRVDILGSLYDRAWDKLTSLRQMSR